jgi:hypothetical protein
MLVAIGGLLLATLVTLQKRQGPTKPAKDAGATGSSAPVPEIAATGVASQTLDPIEETPEWEPHAAARPAPEEVIPAESLDAAPSAAVEEVAPPEDVWADPTPTAMSDAVGLDEEATETPEEDAASFSSLMEDEPFATAGTATAEADDPFAASDEDLTATPEAEAPQDEIAASAAGGDVPDEEPFERAGRWWFKRGSELLVYNEQSGEWVPSPTPLPELDQPAPSRFGPDSSATQTISDLTAASPEVDSGSASAAEEEREPSLIESTGQQGFWRCQACGAVNGSTSATCRMCFAARPAS